MAQLTEADILTSSDHLSNTTANGGLEPWPEAGSAFNIGIMLFRPSAQPLAKVLSGLLRAHDFEKFLCLSLSLYL